MTTKLRSTTLLRLALLTPPWELLWFRMPPPECVNGVHPIRDLSTLGLLLGFEQPVQNLWEVGVRAVNPMELGALPARRPFAVARRLNHERPDRKPPRTPGGQMPQAGRESTSLHCMRGVHAILEGEWLDPWDVYWLFVFCRMSKLMHEARKGKSLVQRTSAHARTQTLQVSENRHNHEHRHSESLAAIYVGPK